MQSGSLIGHGKRVVPEYTNDKGTGSLRAPPRILRPPAPVEVKKAGRCAFVQKPLLGYNQGESPSTATLMKSPVQENRTPGYFDQLSTGLCGAKGVREERE
jgi:hypothetical protein